MNINPCLEGKICVIRIHLIAQSYTNASTINQSQASFQFEHLQLQYCGDVMRVYVLGATDQEKIILFFYYIIHILYIILFYIFANVSILFDKILYYFIVL